MKNFALDQPIYYYLPNLAGALGMFMKIDDITDVQNVSFDELLTFVKQIKKTEKISRLRTMGII